MYFPALQAKQYVAPGSELVPFLQGAHFVLLDSSAYVFAAHSLHLSAPMFPTSLEYFPGGQELQPSETPFADK
jgi:hypothetical protein